MLEEKEYKLLCPVVCDPEKITFEISENHLELSSDIRNYIDQVWMRATAEKNRFLFNGRVVSLSSYSYKSGSLHLVLEETDYKSFYVLNILADSEKFKDTKTNALAICAATVTSDDRVIIGKRSAMLAEGSECWHVPGGTLDKRVLDGAHPFSVIISELKEEFNIDSSDIESTLCIGLGENEIYHKPELLSEIRLNITAAEVKERMSLAIDYDEHTEVRFVHINEIIEFLQINRVSPIGRLCLERFLTVSQLRR